jgi:hypothetical protein
MNTIGSGKARRLLQDFCTNAPELPEVQLNIAERIRAAAQKYHAPPQNKDITKTSARKIVTVKNQKYILQDVGFSIFFPKEG